MTQLRRRCARLKRKLTSELPFVVIIELDDDFYRNGKVLEPEQVQEFRRQAAADEITLIEVVYETELLPETSPERQFIQLHWTEEG